MAAVLSFALVFLYKKYHQRRLGAREAAKQEEEEDTRAARGEPTPRHNYDEVEEAEGLTMEERRDKIIVKLQGNQAYGTSRVSARQHIPVKL